MYCPRCGDLLTMSTDGELQCTRGDMQLSKHLEQRLREVYELDLRFPEKHVLDKERGGWFCPKCGVRLERSAEVYACPNCSRTIGEFVFELIELHPHHREPT